MARIAGVNVPDNKHTVIALTYIFGVGNSQAKRICTEPCPAVLLSQNGLKQDLKVTKFFDFEFCARKVFCFFGIDFSVKKLLGH